MEILPIELVQYLMKYLYFEDKIKLKSLSRSYYYGLRIYDLLNIRQNLTYKLNENILRNFPFIKYLRCESNYYISNLNNFSCLQILIAPHNKKINDEGIKYLNLIELNIYYSPNITNVNHMTNLRKLNAGGKCGISDYGIKDLNLYELEVFGNSKITNLNHMTNLKKLNIGGLNSKIYNEGIKNLNLIKLDINSNYNITNINHMTKIKKLYAWNSQLEYEDIKNLNLIELRIDWDSKITNYKNIKLTRKGNRVIIRN